MRLTIILLSLLLPFAAQAGLYKCLDQAGHITYTNTACDKAGLKEAKLIPPPPPPAVDARVVNAPSPAVKPPANKVVNATPPEAAPAEAKPAARIALTKTTNAGAGNCEKMNQQIGQVMDEMDEARRAGYTAKQEAEWGQKLSRMQAERARMNCF